MPAADNNPTPAGAVSRRDVISLAGEVVALAGVPGAASAAAAQPLSATPLVALGLAINGAPVQVEIDPRMSLLDLLRERLGLTGTKKGCNQGACGACTVLLDGRRVNACLTLAVMHQGSTLITIEGLAPGHELHPLQAAFIEHDGFQCGYCTAGQIMSGVGCIAEGHAATPDDVRFWMSGNICRCGAYPGIVEAIVQTAARS